MSRKEPRQLKELRNLMPFAWDTRKEKHPPGAASMRDFQDCLQFSFKQRYSSIDEADTGHRKRRKKALEDIEPSTEIADANCGKKQSFSKNGQTCKQEAETLKKTAPSPATWKGNALATPSAVQSLQRTPGSGVSEVTPACRSVSQAGHISNTLASHLSTGMAFSPAVAGAVEQSRWQESPPVPTKLLKEATPDEAGLGSEPMCTTILKTKRSMSLDSPGDTAADHPADHPADDLAEETERLLEAISPAHPAMAHQDCSSDGQVPVPADDEHSSPAGHDSPDSKAVEDDVQPVHGCEDTDFVTREDCGPATSASVQTPMQSPQHGKGSCKVSKQTCVIQTAPPPLVTNSSSGVLPFKKATLEIKALHVQAASSQTLPRPLSAMAESRCLSEPSQTCPPLFQKPSEQKTKTGRPASIGNRKRAGSAGSGISRLQSAAGMQSSVALPTHHHTPEHVNPAGREAFLFASAVMVLGGHYKNRSKQTMPPPSPEPLPRGHGSLLQACKLLGMQDAGRGWTSY